MYHIWYIINIPYIPGKIFYQRLPKFFLKMNIHLGKRHFQFKIQNVTYGVTFAYRLFLKLSSRVSDILIHQWYIIILKLVANIVYVMPYSHISSFSFYLILKT